MRLVFCGTPEFAVPTLQRLLQSGHAIELVVTQPDRAAGRGLAPASPPVKAAAAAANLAIAQPEKIRQNLELQARLESIRPEVIVVVAYGKIIPRWMLDLPPLGNLNLHASLLPKYRGAAPIQWAVANGEKVTGVTTMRIDEGLDTGPILLQREIPIGDEQSAADLFPVLAEAGAQLMAETLDRLCKGDLTPVPQDGSLASHAPLLARKEGLIDFHRPAAAIYNRWRGFHPWPGAYAYFRSKKAIFHRLQPAGAVRSDAAPGEIAIDAGRLFVAAGAGSWLEILELQMEGKRRLTAEEFLRGAAHSFRSGARERFTSELPGGGDDPQPGPGLG